MNHDLDRLFELARKELRAEMPIETVKQLVLNRTAKSFWKRNQSIFMGTVIMGLMATAFSIFLINTSAKEVVVLTENKTPLHTENLSTKNEPITDKISLENILAGNQVIKDISAKTNQLLPIEKIHPDKATKSIVIIDSLIPKETFREYKLQIQRDNSEKEIKKLQAELERYGIHLEIIALDYDNQNKIKRFNGKFTTDSLFCGEALKSYDFDVSGAFQQIEFTFRVAPQEQKLKYLKIESDDFEETIECYEDEVIADISAADKLSEKAEREMRSARLEMEQARLEMEKAMENMNRNFNEEFKFQFDEEFKNFSIELDNELKKLKNKDWKKMGEDIRREIEQSIKRFDSKEFKEELEEEMKNLKEHLREMELEIKEEIEMAREHSDDRSSEEMRDEAKSLKAQAKALEKEAKRKAKEEKKSN